MENEMNQNNPTSNTPETPVQEEGAIGAVIGSVVVVIILIVVGFYLWSSSTEKQSTIPQVATSTVQTQTEVGDPTTQSLTQQSTSTDLGSIEKDLNATDLNALDKELADIAAETGF
jgi:type IV secretory pathway VirB10-like protein